MRLGRRQLAVALTAAATGFVLVGVAPGQPIEFPTDPARQASVSSLDGLERPLERIERGLRKAQPPPIPAAVREHLEAIASCESGGNPRSVSADGTYRGKYQFDRGTWKAVGGKGDPARASEAEQDRRAWKLLEQSGSSPWPVCG